ncbi:MAG: hypothetical protein CM1200mP14_28470 [Gammaproteobacteria bacterium]|nr:MAG: hypothetical protein CM1200mP14_28470 [Gammaproteobacteria bacterium]
MREAAAETGTFLCVGLWKETAPIGRYALLHFALHRCRWVTVWEKHRKLKPTAAERLIWGEGMGARLLRSTLLSAKLVV